MPTNRYLEGVYAPVTTEETLTELKVTGTLPAHLDGRYLRNGPNPITAPDPATYHWFTGTGMVHGLRLRDGKAEWYRNRWVRSPEVVGVLGGPETTGPIHEGFDFAPNTNVIGHAGRTFAIVEAGSNPYELTDELDTVGRCDFEGTLGGGGYTAHPHADPATGELHAVSYFFGWGNKVRYSVLGTDGRIRRLVDVETTGSPMIHDFSLTADHAVIYDLPVVFDLEAAMAGTGLPYFWDPEYPARVGLLPREGNGTDVRWFEVDPCYVFHPLNAFEDGDTTVLDVVRHPKMFDKNRLGPDEGKPVLERWALDRSSGKTLTTRLDDRNQEFPRIDERLTGHRHRYGYTVGSVAEPDAAVGSSDVLLRHDLVAGTSQQRSFGTGTSTGEFVFVPSSPDAAEDDGILMGLVVDVAEGTTTLEVVDAATLESIAAVHLPVRVPAGFHGNWVPTA
jgi:carotenoid cleavage dioxygenase